MQTTPSGAWKAMRMTLRPQPTLRQSRRGSSATRKRGTTRLTRQPRPLADKGSGLGRSPAPAPPWAKHTMQSSAAYRCGLWPTAPKAERVRHAAMRARHHNARQHVSGMAPAAIFSAAAGAAARSPGAVHSDVQCDVVAQGSGFLGGRAPTYSFGIDTGAPYNGAGRAIASTAISGGRRLGHSV